MESKCSCGTGLIKELPLCVELVPGIQEPSLYFRLWAWTLGTQNPPRQSSLGVKSSQPGSFIKLKMMSLSCISPLPSPFPISTDSARLWHQMQVNNNCCITCSWHCSIFHLCWRKSLAGHQNSINQPEMSRQLINHHTAITAADAAGASPLWGHPTCLTELFRDLHPTLCSRNNLILGKTKSCGTSWRNGQFLHSKRLLVTAQAQRDHSKTLPKSPHFVFLNHWKCRDWRVYKEMCTQSVSWGTPWVFE